MTYTKWIEKVYINRNRGQRWGQAMMNASPAEWWDVLPDVWEVDRISDALLLPWDEHAAKVCA